MRCVSSATRPQTGRGRGLLGVSDEGAPVLQDRGRARGLLAETGKTVTVAGDTSDARTPRPSDGLYS